MARPREFDQQQALLQAMHAFWSKGYEATSLTDLLQATGLSKSSLYDTFGSKRGLFLAAFERYRQERHRMLGVYLASEPTAYASIAAFFAMVLKHACADDRPFGCMSCNEAVELGPHDDEVHALIERDFLGIEDAFAKAIERGKTDGSITSTKSNRELARFLMVNHQGLQIMARTRAHPQRLKDALTVMLTALR